MLTSKLEAKGFLKEEKIKSAFQKIDRKDFVSEKSKNKAYMDIPLPIGEGQTISQPSVVAFMIEWLDPQPGNKILDIGSGSGWTTALLAEIVGKKGKIFGLERFSELKEYGKENVAKYNFLDKGQAEIIVGDGYQGLPKQAPFDRILVSASLSGEKQIPTSWNKQLKDSGIVVTPIKNSIYKLTKQKEEFKKESQSGFRFVPLVKDE